MVIFFSVMTVLLIEVNCRNINRHLKDPTYYVDKANILESDLEDALAEKCFESVQPAYLRKTRQVQGGASTNPDGTYNVNANDPLVGNDKNAFWPAIGFNSAFDNDMGKYGAADLALDNVYVL